MKNTNAILLLAAVLLCSAAVVQSQWRALRGIKESSPVQAILGSNLTLHCQVNGGPSFPFYNDITWSYVRAAGEGETEEVTLTRLSALMNREENRDRYSIDVESTRNKMVFALTIKNVSSQSEGTYVCRVTPHDNPGNSVQDEVEVDVVTPPGCVCG